MSRGEVWPAELADSWRYYVPPNRPSRFELDVCARIAAEMLVGLCRPLKILCLGSTSEYRDLAFELRAECVIVDNSLGYWGEVSKEVRHPTDERLVLSDWLEMDFCEDFDLVLGDLVVGQLDQPDVPDFLSIINRSLVAGGAFLTKSFFQLADPCSRFDVHLKLKELRNYHGDIFPHVVFPLASACADDDDLLEFARMFNLLVELRDSGVMTHDQFGRFTELGWSSSMKFRFLMLRMDEWRRIASSHFSDVIEYNDSTAPYGVEIPMFHLVK